MSDSHFRPLAMLLILFSGFLFLVSSDSSYASDESGGAAFKLLEIGKAGPKAIHVTIGAKKSEAEGKDGPVSITLNPVSQAYVTAIYISPQGDTMVVFPNKKEPNNLLAPGKDHTIVSADCGLKLGFSESANKGKIVVYISSQPMQLDQEKPGGVDDFVTVSNKDVAAIEALAKRIGTVSKDDHFNKKIITSETLHRLGQGDSIMGLPGGVASTLPESVAGVQGVKSKIKSLGKD